MCSLCMSANKKTPGFPPLHCSLCEPGFPGYDLLLFEAHLFFLWEKTTL